MTTDDQFRLYLDGYEAATFGHSVVVTFRDDYTMLARCISGNLNNSVNEAARFAKVRHLADELFAALPEVSSYHLATELIDLIQRRELQGLEA